MTQRHLPVCANAKHENYSFFKKRRFQKISGFSYLVERSTK